MTPEHRLWTAVITLALKDALGPKKKGDKDNSVMQKSKRWLTPMNACFIEVCGLASMDSEWVLRKYEQAKEKQRQDFIKKFGFLTTR